MAVNDVYEPDAAINFERLLRGLLDLPQRPAVVAVQTIGLDGKVGCARFKKTLRRTVADLWTWLDYRQRRRVPSLRCRCV